MEVLQEPTPRILNTYILLLEFSIRYAGLATAKTTSRPIIPSHDSVVDTRTSRLQGFVRSLNVWQID